MKVLVVKVPSCEFSEEHSYRLAFQGKVFTNVAEPSKTPDFTEEEVRVPFAVVRDGKEVLVVTVHRRIVDEDGSERFERVGQAATPLVSPGKDAKEGVVEIVSGKENSVITGKIVVSYQLIRITMRESLRGGAAPIGMNIHGGFYGGSPTETELHLYNNDSLIGTGKLPVSNPSSFLEVSQAISENILSLHVMQKGHAEVRVPVRSRGPFVAHIPQGTSGACLLAVQHSKIVRTKKFLGLITDDLTPACAAK